MYYEPRDNELWICIVALLYIKTYRDFYYTRTVDDMVVKLASWLVKSYDFTSQHRYIVLNRVENSKTSKLGQTRLKSVKIGELG